MRTDGNFSPISVIGRATYDQENHHLSIDLIDDYAIEFIDSLVDGRPRYFILSYGGTATPETRQVIEKYEGAKND